MVNSSQSSYRKLYTKWSIWSR